MDTLNNKVSSTQDEVKFTAQNVGLYGYDSATQGGKWRRVNADPSGQLHVAVAQHLVDSPDLKARTDIADPATSTFLKCNTDGTLEMTAELSTAGLATEAKQNAGNNTLSSIDNKIILPSVLNSDQLKVNDSAVVGSLAVLNNNITTGNQASKSMGNNSGSDVQIKVDAGGVQEVSGTVSTTISGVSTEAKQDTINTSIGTSNSTLTDIEAHQGNIENNLSSIQSTVTSNKLQVDVITSALPTGAATQATLADVEAHQGNIENNLSSIQSTVSSNKLQVDVITSALPTGAATETTLAAAEAHLGTIDTSTAALAGCVSGTELQVDIVSGGGGGTQFAGEATLASTGTGTAMIGRDNTGTARLAAMDTSGNLQIDIVANSDTTKATSTLQGTGNASLSSIDGKVATQTTLAAAEAHLGTIDTSTASLAGCVSGTEVQVDVVNRTDSAPTALTFSAGNKIIGASGVTSTAAIDVGGCSNYSIMLNMLTATANSADLLSCKVIIEYSPDDGSTFMGTVTSSGGGAPESIIPAAFYEPTGGSASTIIGYGVYIVPTLNMTAPTAGNTRSNKIRIKVQNNSGNALTLDSFSIYKYQ